MYNYTNDNYSFSEDEDLDIQTEFPDIDFDQSETKMVGFSFQALNKGYRIMKKLGESTMTKTVKPNIINLNQHKINLWAGVPKTAENFKSKMKNQKKERKWFEIMAKEQKQLKLKELTQKKKQRMQKELRNDRETIRKNFYGTEFYGTGSLAVAAGLLPWSVMAVNNSAEANSIQQAMGTKCPIKCPTFIEA